MTIMTKTSLSQSSERGAHLLTTFQRLHRQGIYLGALFADLETLVDLVRRNYHDTVQICYDQISRIDRERLRLLW